jgi:hypothetical protein
MMTLKPVPDRVLRQIVDDIFIPWSRGATRGMAPADREGRISAHS